MAAPRQGLAITRADWEELRDRMLTLELGQSGIQKSLLEHYEQEKNKFDRIEEDKLALDDRVGSLESKDTARRNWAFGAMVTIGLLWPVAWEKIKLFFK